MEPKQKPDAVTMMVAGEVAEDSAFDVFRHVLPDLRAELGVDSVAGHDIVIAVVPRGQARRVQDRIFGRDERRDVP